ncbi:CoA-acylating methylmalonate-semialdehyde dehydrogenase [Gracilibacillus salinarum]|uniref:methylmalonate-semialdehyde dehydrogenase (CoA acylating) n=1 Tax=Gracilibacillus salinarum TaxID=2932255 RepID=A0ABY4GJC6_9BACI|nr:CoA-acylating methylmalonate-semialdehyde dehydrogenase [Gracilibacillus salinarum]UOQ84461.1 CoA-acylating methylmalonate-semialdehyde dehydrogenase [Gracilibacillus salinarum]
MSKIEVAGATLQNFINGEWVDAYATESQPVVNPATEECLTNVPLSSDEDVDRAVQSSLSAFGEWKKTPVSKRARILFRYHQLLTDHHQFLAEMVSEENGKSYKEAYGEVLRGIECVEFATSAPTLMMGDNLSTIASDIDSEFFRYPIGVVAGIAPFNFPMMVPCWMFPIAIACGNTFLLKPSEKTPLLANKLVALLDEAGLPKGVLNVVHGTHEVVNRILDHPDIAAVSFVGSDPVAKYVYQNAASNGKRVQALAGAKNHHIVLPDCDQDRSIDHIINSAFGSAGQRCMACSAVIAVGDKADSFIAMLKKKADQIKIGNGMDEDVTVTPLISQESRNRALDYIDKGIAEGAQLIRDGRIDMETFNKGNFLGPTIFDYVTPDMSIAENELFAPILSVIRAADLKEAIDIINQSKFGNSATLYTNSASAVRTFREEAEPGMLGVNVGVPAPMAFFPFSGWKHSFYGDLHVNGKDGVEFYTRKKMITSRFY